MEYINKVELQGVVGSVKTNGLITSFSLLVQSIYANDCASGFIRSDWYSIISTSTIKLESGTEVHVFGKLSSSKYLDSSNIERTNITIMADEVFIL